MHKHVQALVDAGLVEPMEGKRRGVRVRRAAMGDANAMGDTRTMGSANPNSVRGMDGGVAQDQRAIGPISGKADNAVSQLAARDITDVPSPAGLALPWLGNIAAGRPIEAIEAPQTIEVPPALMPHGYSRRSGHPERNYYVLRVRGDSMCDDAILDGDWVVVEHRETARNGQVVVALIDDAEATLKRIEQRVDACVLHPCNTNYEPMVFEPARVRVQGVVVAQMRKYD